MRKDADRYSLLRDPDNEIAGAEIKCPDDVWEFCAGDALDQYIDAAIASSREAAK